MTTYEFEYTDTFGGDANYSWGRRGTVTVKEGSSDAAIVRAVKRALGLSGVRCRKESLGETIALYPVGSCTVIFIY